jgi:hypothetical protein
MIPNMPWILAVLRLYSRVFSSEPLGTVEFAYIERQHGAALAQRHLRAAHLRPSLSLNFITRVAPHCVNTLMILHAAPLL